MKVTTLLSSQHDEASRLFERFEELDTPTERRRMFEHIARHLTAHARAEQEIFYPACAVALPGAAQLVREGVAEHNVMSFALLHADVAPDDDLLPRVSVLMEQVEQHVLDEERDVFPSMERAMDDSVCEALGSAMKARFDELVQRDFRDACRQDVRAALEPKAPLH